MLRAAKLLSYTMRGCRLWHRFEDDRRNELRDHHLVVNLGWNWPLSAWKLLEADTNFICSDVCCFLFLLEGRGQQFSWARMWNERRSDAVKLTNLASDDCDTNQPSCSRRLWSDELPLSETLRRNLIAEAVQMFWSSQLKFVCALILYQWGWANRPRHRPRCFKLGGRSE